MFSPGIASNLDRQRCHLCVRLCRTEWTLRFIHFGDAARRPGRLWHATSCWLLSADVMPPADLQIIDVSMKSNPFIKSQSSWHRTFVFQFKGIVTFIIAITVRYWQVLVRTW